MDIFTLIYHIAPFILLPLAGLGFILTLIADNWQPQKRFNVAVVMCLVACAAVMGMGR